MKADHYWEQADYEEMAMAKTFGDLVPISIRIIGRMPQPVVLVSGPISSGGKGSLTENLKVFEDAIITFMKKGYSVFNQLPFEPKLQELSKDYKEYCTPILDDIFLPILKSGLIKKMFFIPGWESSVGARWEYNICEKLKIEQVLLSPEDLL